VKKCQNFHFSYYATKKKDPFYPKKRKILFLKKLIFWKIAQKFDREN